MLGVDEMIERAAREWLAMELRKAAEKTMLLLRSAALLAAAAVAEGKAAASKPHIITLVIDDLGQPAHRQRESCSVPGLPWLTVRGAAPCLSWLTVCGARAQAGTTRRCTTRPPS